MANLYGPLPTHAAADPLPHLIGLGTTARDGLLEFLANPLDAMDEDMGAASSLSTRCLQQRVVGPPPTGTRSRAAPRPASGGELRPGASHQLRGTIRPHRAGSVASVGSDASRSLGVLPS